MRVLENQYILSKCMRGSRGWWTGGPDYPEKSQMAIVFLRNIGTDPTLEAFGPLASKCI